MCTRAATTTLRRCPLALNDESPAEPQTDSSVCRRKPQHGTNNGPTGAQLLPGPDRGRQRLHGAGDGLRSERVQPDPPRMLLVWLHKGWI